MATQVWTGALSTDPTVAGNWVSLTAPVTGDTVLFGNGTGALQNPVTFAADSIVFGAIDCTGYTSTMTVSSHALNCSGSVTLPNGMTFTSNSTSSLVLSGTGTVTTGSMINLPQTVTINAPGATVTQGSAWTLAGTTAGVLTLTAGTLNTNGFAVATGAFSCNNSNTRTLTLGASVITCSFAGLAVDFNVPANLTMTANTGTFVLTGSNAVFRLGSAFNFNGLSVSFTGSAAAQLNATGGTIAKVTRTGTAVKTDSFLFGGSSTVTGTITLGGNTQQGANRLLVQSSVIGTQRVITATGAAVVINGDVDFQDIAFSGSPSWTNTAGGGSFVGDCGGNGALIAANITAPTTQHLTDTTGSKNWSTATWTSHAPLPQDTVVVDPSLTGNLTITADMPRLGGSIDFSGSTLNGHTLAVTLGVATTIFGSLNLTHVGASSLTGAFVVTFGGRSTYTLTNGGVTFPNGVTLNAPTGTLSMADAFTCGAHTLTHTNGTLVDGGQTVAANAYTQAAGTKTLTATGTWTLSGTGTIATFTSTTTTNNCSGMTIVVGNNSSSSKTVSFAGALTTGPAISYTPAGTGTLLLTLGGALTLAGLTVTGAVRTLSITHGQTLTLSACSLSGPVTVTSDTSAAATFRTADGRFLCSVTTALAQFSALSWTTGSPIATLVSTHTFNATAFVVRGASGALATLNASVGGSAAALTMATGAFALAGYCTVTDITANRLLDRYAAIGTGTSGVTIDHGLLTEVGAG